MTEDHKPKTPWWGEMEPPDAWEKEAVDRMLEEHPHLVNPPTKHEALRRLRLW